MSDSELLRRFSDTSDNDAFAQLVTRHLGLVYGAAFRQTSSSALAQDVAQTVFIEFARQAGKLRADTHLPSWLYVATRRTALDILRSEIRRQKREQIAIQLMDTPPDSAAALAPVIDETLTTLDEADRQAVLMRFFEGKSFSEISHQLGVSEDTAQKRLSRALDRVRAKLSKRGITTTAALLASALAASANTPAPAGLAALITSQATTALLTTSSAFAAAKTIAMTTTQKLIIGSSLAIAIGGLVFQTARVVDLRQKQERTEADHQSQMARLNQLLSATQKTLDDISNKSSPPDSSTVDPIEAHARILAKRVAMFRRIFTSNPGEGIPELVYLKDYDWIKTAAEYDPNSAAGLRRGLSALRNSAVAIAALKIQASLRLYVEKHAYTLPADLAALKPYFSEPIDPAILERYELTASGMALKTIKAIRLKLTELKDEEFDSVPAIGTYLINTAPLNSLQQEELKGTAEGQEKLWLKATVDEVVERFQIANAGKMPKSLDEIRPYFKNKEDADRYSELLKKYKRQ